MQHNTAKLADVHKIAEAFQGNLLILNEKLRHQYNKDLNSFRREKSTAVPGSEVRQAQNIPPPPTTSAHAKHIEEMKRKLAFLYSYHRPENVQHVSVLLERHKHNVEKLNALLRQKYGVDLSCSEDEICAGKSSVQQIRAYAGSSSASPTYCNMYGSVSASPVKAPQGSSAGPMSAPQEYCSADQVIHARSTSAGPIQEPSGQQRPFYNQYGQVLRKPPQGLTKTEKRETSGPEVRASKTAPADPRIVQRLENFYKLHAPEKAAKAGEIAKLFGADLYGLDRCLAAKYNGATLTDPRQPRQVRFAPSACRVMKARDLTSGLAI